jgi:UDP-hydrolysing UDP-N-acetyl-D-glucosamine 2-epimerase
MRKILGITGIRSDYDLLSSLYRQLGAMPDVNMRLLVGGAHLSRSYGHTVDMIVLDGVPILAKVESLIDGDSISSRLKTASIFLQGAIDVVAAWSPDLIIYAGDREEVWIGAMLGAYLEIPTAHFYAGDHTRTGHVDNPIRHAVSKLSTVQFVATDEHRDRLMAMGESPHRIFVTGNLSLDNFMGEPVQSFEALRQRMGLPCAAREYAIVLFHPDTSERDVAPQYMHSILDGLRDAGIGACVGYPNTDPANQRIIEVIERHRSGAGVFVYRNLDRQDFITLYRNARLLIGNSSSGIIEAASIPLPAINVGLRQRGRAVGDNVLFCDGDDDAVRGAIHQALDPVWWAKVSRTGNPYGDGQATQRALHWLMSLDFPALRLKTEDPLDQWLGRSV